MNARWPLHTGRRHFWIGALAAAVFGLRALIPTGYMLAAVDGHTRLVVCQVAIHGFAQMAHASGVVHAAGMHHDGHGASGPEHCPYALSGGASLLAAHHEPAEPYYSLLQPAPAPILHSVSAAPPARYHAPRGPPSPA